MASDEESSEAVSAHATHTKRAIMAKEPLKTRAAWNNISLLVPVLLRFVDSVASPRRTPFSHLEAFRGGAIHAPRVAALAVLDLGNALYRVVVVLPKRLLEVLLVLLLSPEHHIHN